MVKHCQVQVLIPLSQQAQNPGVNESKFTIGTIVCDDLEIIIFDFCKSG